MRYKKRDLRSHPTRRPVPSRSSTLCDGRSGHEVLSAVDSSLLAFHAEMSSDSSEPAHSNPVNSQHHQSNTTPSSQRRFATVGRACDEGHTLWRDSRYDCTVSLYQPELILRIG